MRIHYDLTDAVVCVVDSIYDRMDETKEQIDEIIKVGCKKAPILVMANNRDEPNASRKGDITEELGLTKIADREWSKFDDSIQGGWMGGSRCCMSIIRNGNVALSNLRNTPVAMSNLRNTPVTCH